MKHLPSVVPGWLAFACCVLSALFAFAQVGPRPLPAKPSPMPAASAGVVSAPAPVALSPAIYPPQRITLTFDHRKHVTELAIGCTNCHDRATTSQRASDRLLPTPTRCDGCHGSDHSDLLRVVLTGAKPQTTCRTCHATYSDGSGNAVERQSFPPPNLKFNHAAHKDTPCSKCHSGVERTKLATRESLPGMRICLECHRAPQGAAGPSAVCGSCHLMDGSRLRTRFASGELLPPAWMNGANHGTDWLTRHRMVAGDDSRLCANCHTEKSCTDCHDGKVRPRRVHPNDYLSLHAPMAQMDSGRCASCHQQQTFCAACHQRLGVSSGPPTGPSGDRGRFHPPASVWSSGPLSPRHHAWQAERNLNACTSCHGERDCVSCHAARGVGGPTAGSLAGNPHPPGFRMRCGTALRKNPRPCLLCHGAQDPNLGACGG